MTPAETHALTVDRTAHVVTMGGANAPRALVALHGYGQRADLFARHLAPHAGPERRIVVPEALSRFYLEVPTPDVLHRGPARRRVGASWMTLEHRDAEIADLVAYLDRAVGAFVPPAAATDSLGFSQGAAALCRWATGGHWATWDRRATRGRRSGRGTGTDARPLNRLILWGGLVPDDVLADADAVQRLPPVTLVCGDADAYLTPEAVAAHAARVADAGISVTHRTFAGGHCLDAATLADVLGP